jgi:3-oxoacyl-[acyl-carrier protein] reductase
MGIQLDNKVAIITGGANGIGRAAALTFARAGAKVAVWDMAAEAGQAVVKEITDAGGQAAFFKVNVTAQADVAAAAAAVAERFGKIDILVNNAGITRDAQFLKVKDGQVVGKMSEEDFDLVVSVNLKGVFNCTQAVAPYILAAGGGHIVNTSSLVALYGNFGQTNYVATKAGVIGLTRVWARELGRRGITVNAVAPGFIATDMTAAMPEKVIQEMIAHVPLGRAGQPQDVANLYLFLASEEGAYLNGAVISIDGGLVIGT